MPSNLTARVGASDDHDPRCPPFLLRGRAPAMTTVHNALDSFRVCGRQRGQAPTIVTMRVGASDVYHLQHPRILLRARAPAMTAIHDALNIHIPAGGRNNKRTKTTIKISRSIATTIRIASIVACSDCLECRLRILSAQVPTYKIFRCYTTFKKVPRRSRRSPVTAVSTTRFLLGQIYI